MLEYVRRQNITEHDQYLHVEADLALKLHSVPNGQVQVFQTDNEPDIFLFATKDKCRETLGHSMVR